MNKEKMRRAGNHGAKPSCFNEQRLFLRPLLVNVDSRHGLRHVSEILKDVFRSLEELERQAKK